MLLLDHMSFPNQIVCLVRHKMGNGSNASCLFLKLKVVWCKTDVFSLVLLP